MPAAVAVDNRLGYFETNAQRMRYAAFRQDHGDPPISPTFLSHTRARPASHRSRNNLIFLTEPRMPTQLVRERLKLVDIRVRDAEGYSVATRRNL
jgi:hypothetical protein